MKSYILVLYFAFVPVLYGYSYRFKDQLGDTEKKCFTKEMDRGRGGDLLDLKRHENIPTSGECEALCRSKPKCASYSYYTDSHWEYPRRCNLYTNAWDSQVIFGSVTGAKTTCAVLPKDGIPVALFLNKEKPIVRNALVATIPLLPKQYDISFDFKPTKWIGGWTSILHMTTGGNAGWGKRIPGFFPYYQKVAISNGIDGNGNWYFWSPKLTLNKWVHFRLTQNLEGQEYVYRVYMNKQLLKTKVNKKPQDFKQVDIWVGDNWYNAQPGFIRNLRISGTTDTDMCATDNGGCSQICENGQCKCKPGWQLDDDKSTCNDIDECATNKGGCPASNRVCQNLPGSFRCNHCSAGDYYDKVKNICSAITVCLKDKCP